MTYPTNKQTFSQTQATDKTDAVDHNGIHNNLATTVNALQDKVGINSDTNTTSFDYKLSEVTSTDKAVGKSATQTLTNKTLTAPSISNPNFTTTISNLDLTTPRITTSINDANGNEVIKTPATASAVNEITVTNSATGNDVQVTATGDDTNIGLKVKAKGSGKVKLGTADLQFPNVDGSSGQVMQTNGAGVLSWASTLASIPLLASDGSDGNVTISSGTTTLTRDMYYNNLTVNGTGTLVTAGYKIFVKGLTTVDTSGGGGGINHRGGNGGNASGATGGAAGTITNGTQLSQAQDGKAGGNGAASAGNNGSNGVAGTTTTFNLVNSNGVAGGVGGSTGFYVGGIGGGGGTASSGAGIATRDIVTASNLMVWTSATAVQRPNTTAGSGSGGGGASVSGIGGGGGGSGATGGHVFLATTQLDITGTGAINANGGNGGNGANGSAGGGGGAGGNGGVVTVIYYSKTGTGTITAIGGTGGVAGIASDAVVAPATNGANGNNGIVIEITA